MKKVGIITNLNKDISAAYTMKVADWLTEHGMEVAFSTELENVVGNRLFMEVEQLHLWCEFIVVLGGDGTILQAARTASLYDVPIFGINLGTLGYLTDVERSEAFAALEKVIKGEYKTEKRMMIEAEISGQGYETRVERLIALNDICVLRGAVSKVITLDLKVNDIFMDTYRADGIIVATPTGSTAYNLSAGGPILKPDIELIAITPVCPHKIYSRSSVVSADDVVSLEIGECHGGEPILSLDGQEYVNLEKGQRVKIYKSSVHTTLIRTNDFGFYDILRKKFH